MYCEFCGSGPACGVCGRDDRPCLQCNRPAGDHVRYTAADVSASKADGRPGLSPAVVGTFKGHDPLIAGIPRGWDHV